MEYLSRCSNDMCGSGNFRYNPRDKKNGITHILFADDLLLFCYGDVGSMKSLCDAFHKFSQASSLQSNLDKCEIYVDGVVEDAVLKIKECGGICQWVSSLFSS